MISRIFKKMGFKYILGNDDVWFLKSGEIISNGEKAKVKHEELRSMLWLWWVLVSITWRAGKRTKEISDFPFSFHETSIDSGFSSQPCLIKPEGNPSSISTI